MGGKMKRRIATLLCKKGDNPKMSIFTGEAKRWLHCNTTNALRD
jgi:hypothetical protein